MPKGVPLVEGDTGRPYIRVTDFRNHSVRDEGILFVPRGYEDIIRRYRISSRDVYISIAGSIGLVGQVPGRLNDANLTENAAKIVFEREDILPRYVMYALAGHACQDQIARSTAKNAQPKLALTRIEQLLVPLPPTFDEQREIVAILDAIDRKIDLHHRKRAVLDDLFKALLHKLMTGEIRVADLDLSALTPPKELEAAE
jgi:type I restriction enzyme S subunit